MKRKVLITGPTLTSDALLYAQSHDIQLIPTEPYMAKDKMENSSMMNNLMQSLFEQANFLEI